MTFRSVVDAGALRSEFESSGSSTQFIPIIWRYVLQNTKCELDEVPSLPAAAFPVLRSKFKPMTSSLSSAVDSKDRVTTKLPIRLQVVKLIPFNPIGSSSCFQTSTEQNVRKFQKVLRGVYNIRTTVCQQMGEDISGACGQLVVKSFRTEISRWFKSSH